MWSWKFCGQISHFRMLLITQKSFWPWSVCVLYNFPEQGSFKKYITVGGGYAFVANFYGNVYGVGSVNVFRYVMPKLWCNSRTFSVPGECFQKY